MIKIYHNPKCGTSRNTLAILQQSGAEVEVIEYLKTPPTRAELVALFAAAGETAKTAMRGKQKEAEDRGLLADDVSEDQILDAMMQAPILINRPFVITPKGTALCRPSEKVFALMENPPQSYTKEDGEVITS